jgi:hypothetical protein
MSTLNERLFALLSRRALPDMVVDLACYRRLEAMKDRLVAADPTLGEEGDAMEHVIYAAIMGGLHASELEDGVRYDENTGERLDSTNEDDTA